MSDLFTSLAAVAPPLGPLTELSRTRIGAAQGFASTVYRVHVSAHGRATTVVVKRSDGDGWRHEAAALDVLGDDPALSGAVPALHGAIGREVGGEVVLEDLGELEQRHPGDQHQTGAVAAITGFLAGLHGRQWEFPDPRPFGFGSWELDRWRARIDAASTRYPWVAERAAQLVAWLPEANAAVQRLQGAPRVRIHGDLHYDNLMWRPDGSVVVLDWESAATGPRVVDLAPFVFDRPCDDPAVMLGPYRRAVAAPDGSDVPGLDEQLIDMIRVLIRGTIGWAGREDVEHDHHRFATLRAESARRAIAWFDRLS